MKKVILIFAVLILSISCGPRRLKCGPRRCEFNNQKHEKSTIPIGITTLS